MLLPIVLVSTVVAAETDLPPEAVVVDRIVAVVNDDIITLRELEQAAAPLASGRDDEGQALVRRNVLDQMIADRLLQQQIEEAKIEVTDPEVDRAFQDVLRQNSITEEDLRSAVTARGMSMGQYREDLRRQLKRLKIIDLKVRQRVVVPDTALREAYQQETAGDAVEKFITLRHLFFRSDESKRSRNSARTRAQAARKRILGGEDFAAVAKAVSEGPTAKQGGDLGEVSEKGLLPALAASVRKLPVGQVSAPIVTDNGVHIVEVLSRATRPPRSFESMRGKLYQRLVQKETERQMAIWLKEIRRSGSVEVRLDEE